MRFRKLLHDIKPNRGLLALIGLLLALALLLVYIWHWYDLKNSSLEKHGKEAGIYSAQ